MSYLLITGIIFIAVPTLMIVGISLIITINFAKDDKDAKAILSFALMTILFGIVFVLSHFGAMALR